MIIWDGKPQLRKIYSLWWGIFAIHDPDPADQNEYGSMRHNTVKYQVHKKIVKVYLYSRGAVVRADSMSAVVMGRLAVNPGAAVPPIARL